MGCIDVNGLVERESDVALIQSTVQALREVGEWRLRETSNQLLDVADTLRSGGRIARPETVPQIEVCSSN